MKSSRDDYCNQKDIQNLNLKSDKSNLNHELQNPAEHITIFISEKHRLTNFVKFGKSDPDLS